MGKKCHKITTKVAKFLPVKTKDVPKNKVT